MSNATVTPNRTKPSLTTQQQAIVNHNLGPALVFAVAGAGKTTAMAHRIGRLVAQRVFPPHQILATTFNRAAAQELRERLKQWPGCERVDVRTLHSLGGAIINTAHKRGYLPHIDKKAFARIDQASDSILNKALAIARSNKVSYVDELNQFDRQEFQTMLGVWKGQLAYANLSHAGLPPAAKQIARQAKAPRDKAWYLSLYQLYEEVRYSEGMLTFDDQLMTGWELLVRHPDILAEWQDRYHAVLVDEFQDVNQAQAELLDLITAPHRNYMAIGDDDQTIYEWRGADPSFILDFERRYQAQVYFMTENFRCTAGQITLANAVIRHNRKRRQKQLQLTQGFGGTTAVHLHPTAEAMGGEIAQQIAEAQRNGDKLQELAVLVRVYSQTPPVEQALITLDIPYVVEGDLPFYLRPEVQTLVDYCRLAYLEKQLAAGNGLTTEQEQQFRSSWRQIYWQPKRYLSRDLAGQIESHVLRNYTPLRTTLRLFATQASASVGEKLTQLGEDIHWLTGALAPGPRADESAAKILTQLEERLQYRQYLEEESGFAESGAARADTVTAFLDYAEGKGNLITFLQMLRKLAARMPGKAGNRVEQNSEDKVTITTIFRAKGREWPVVIVPHCNEGFIPYKTAENIEEERRLLYVAITRARRDLHLHHVEKYEISPFLLEARHGDLLGAVQQVSAAASKEPGRWTERDIQALATHTEALQLDGYFTQWSNWDSPKRQDAANAMTRFFRHVADQKLFQRLNLRPNFADLWRALARGGTAIAAAARPTAHTTVKPNQGTTPSGKRTSPSHQTQKKRATNRRGRRTKKTATATWEAGVRVQHAKWGAGTVIQVLPSFSPPAVWVRFDERRAPKRFPADSEELHAL